MESIMWYMPVVERAVVPDRLIRLFFCWQVRNNHANLDRKNVAERHAAKPTLIDNFRRGLIVIFSDATNRQY
jgi:hypothetical protein